MSQTFGVYNNRTENNHSKAGLLDLERKRRASMNQRAKNQEGIGKKPFGIHNNRKQDL